MSQPWTVALGQVRPVLGDVEQNVDKHCEWTRKAKEQGASLIVFPELGLTGYQVQDLTLEVARRLDDPQIQRVVNESQGIDVAFSFVEETEQHLFHVASVYASDGEVQAVHRKVYLPTYGMFDEGRYFAPGNSFRTFKTRVGTAGMLICEDAWHMTSPYLLVQGGANVLLLPASSPARSVAHQDEFGSQSFWRRMLQVYASLLGVTVVFVNRVGFEDGVSFFGGSGVIDADGAWVCEAPVLDESLTLCTVDPEVVRRVRYSTPLMRDEKLEVVMRELGRMTGGATR